jgi:hypothetical protein
VEIDFAICSIHQTLPGLILFIGIQKESVLDIDIPNAFIGRKIQPTDQEVFLSLGPAAGAAWTELISWLAAQGIPATVWKSISPKYGWALRPALKKRTILHLSPCQHCFRAVFILGDKAVAAARGGDLPKSLLKDLPEARRYAEGTGIRLMVHQPDDLASVRKLVDIKLKN